MDPAGSFFVHHHPLLIAQPTTKLTITYCTSQQLINVQNFITDKTNLCTIMAKTTNPCSKQSSSSSTTNQAADMTRRMVCGGLAGMIAKTVTNPLERIKMLSQTGEYGKGKTNGSKVKNVSVMELYKSIIRNEGVIGLWAGNGANLLRVFPVSEYKQEIYV